MSTNTCFINIVVTRKPSQLNDGPPTLESYITVRLSEPSAPLTPQATKETSQSLQILKRGPDQALLSLAQPSDDPNKNSRYIVVHNCKLETNLGERNGFKLRTNISEARGSFWRASINYLRAQFALVSQEEVPATDVSSANESIPSMNPHLIQEFLTTDKRSHSTTWESSYIPCTVVHGISALDTLTAEDTLDTPFAVNISAPNDYSQLDFIDLAVTLSNDFASQSSRDERLSDADTAFFFLWIAVNASRGDHLLENHLDVVREFIASLISRYRTFHRVTDFQEGISLLRSSIASCNPTITPICRDTLISDLVALLCEALSTTDHPTEQLEEMTQWCSENIIPHLPSGAAGVNNFAQLYMARHERSGKLEDLHRSITILQTAVDLPPPDRSERAFILFNITRSLSARYTVLANPSDLELALKYSQESLEMEASGVKLVPRWELLLTLGNILTATDLDGAIDALRESKELCPANQQQRSTILYTLALTLQKRNAARDGQLKEDADESLALEEEALKLAYNATKGLDRCEILINHLHRELPALRQRASTPDDISPYIAKAVDAMKTVQTSPIRHIALHMLGILYYHRYLVGEDAQDISSAYRYFFEALRIAVTGSGYHNVANILSWLARIHLQSKSEFFDIPKAYEYLLLCIDDTHCSAEDRLVFLAECMNDTLSDRNGLSVADLQPPQLSYIYTRALRSTFFETTALEIDLKTGLERLRRFGKLVSRTSLLCYESDQILDAIKALEEGRSIFWQQIFRNRVTPPENIPLELKQRLQSLSEQVEQIRFNEVHPSLYPSPTLEYSRRRRLSLEYNSLIGEIRKQTGSENFLALPLGDIHKVSEHGPIIMLVPYPDFSVMYVLYRKVLEDPGSVILGHTKIKFKQSELQGYIVQLEHANQHIRGEINRSAGSTSIDEDENDSTSDSQADLKQDSEMRAVRARTRATDPFNGVLKNLWVRLVKVILDKLSIKPSKGRDRPRVWWCPTGDFAFLPIHAAGDYSVAGECCSDYVVSSYTPTITALITARKTLNPTRKADITVLLAAVPRPFQGTSLPNTVKELQQVAKMVPSSQRVSLPPSDDVSVDSRAGLSVPTAIAKLPDAIILHLASHGVQDFDNPLNSGFLLRDAKLSLEQLMPIPLPRAFLAFLSACETAKGDQRYIDQAIHLAATMLFAGFKSVIGTMWSMSDIDGPLVASHIYDQIFSGEAEYLDPNVVPYALDEAVQRLRANRVPPSRWATFIHLGM